MRAGYDRSFDARLGASAGLSPEPEVETPVERDELGHHHLRRLVTGCSDIEIDGAAVCLPEGTGFDPGGIGKGLAADLVTEELLEAGAEGACLATSLGGDVRVRGVGPDDEPWTVAVEHPWAAEPIARIGLLDGAVATSTSLKRRWAVAGEMRHHLIDPGTGRPSDSDLTLVSAVAGNGWVAEILAKSVLLRGSVHPFDLIGGMEVEALAVDVTGRIQASTGLRQFLGGMPLAPHLAALDQPLRPPAVLVARPGGAHPEERVMNSQLWWYTARSAGVVSWVLLAASVILGLALSTKALGRRARPNWLLDLHRFLGGAAVVFVGVHVVSIMLDSYVHFGLVEVLVPFTGSWHPAAVAWGIVGLYLLLAVEVTSLLRKRLSKRAWRLTHFLSFPLFVVATVHVLAAGTDRRTFLLRAVVASATIAIAALTAVRVAQASRTDTAPPRTPGRPGPAPARERRAARPGRRPGRDGGTLTHRSGGGTRPSDLDPRLDPEESPWNP